MWVMPLGHVIWPCRWALTLSFGRAVLLDCVVWRCCLALPLGGVIWLCCLLGSAAWPCWAVLLGAAMLFVRQCRLAMVGQCCLVLALAVSFGFAICLALPLPCVFWRCLLALPFVHCHQAFIWQCQFGSVIWQFSLAASSVQCILWHHGRCRLAGSLGGADWHCHWAVGGNLAVLFGNCRLAALFGPIVWPSAGIKSVGNCR